MVGYSLTFKYSLPNNLTQLKALVELTLNDLASSCLPDDIGMRFVTRCVDKENK